MQFKDPPGKQKTKDILAQSASELVIFGAILMFVIGLIARSGFRASLAMNAQLRAWRYALTESKKTAEALDGNFGVYTFNRKASRNTASITLLEDRLSIDAGQKLGSRDRIPIMTMASATYSKQLFYPQDSDELTDNLAIDDVIVNGQRFPLTTSGVKTVSFACVDMGTGLGLGNYSDANCSIIDPSGDYDTPGIPPCSANPPNGGPCWEPNCLEYQRCLQQPPQPFGGGYPYDGVLPNSMMGGTEIQCVLAPPGPCPGPCIPGPCPGIMPDPCPGPNPGDPGGTGEYDLVTIPGGCAVFYKIVGNYTSSSDWNPNCFECFNLDFDLTTETDPDPLAVGTGADVDNPGVDGIFGTPDDILRADFFWQWGKVAGISNKEKNNLNFVGGALNGLEGIWVPGPEDGRGPDVNILLDVDGDFKEETVRVMSADSYSGAITSLTVIDYQEGDIDASHNDRDDLLRVAQGLPALEPIGFNDDIQMFSFTGGGTVLRIEEGKLFNPATGQFVRETSRQDHADIIQRGFRISNNTNRFCNGSPGSPQPDVSGMTNPVEICCDSYQSVCNPGPGMPAGADLATGCFDNVAIELTCMDTHDLIIYIRSRIKDLRGRRWVTRIDPQG